MQKFSVLGKRNPRIDATEKATGQAKFTVDIKLPGMLYAKVLRSSRPHAEIVRIDTTKAEKLAGVAAVITEKDVPHRDLLLGIYPTACDEPPLARGKVRYIGEIIAAVAAVDEDTAEAALDLIDVEYKDLPAVFDPEQAMGSGAVKIHDEIGFPESHKVHNNVACSCNLEVGDVDKAFQESDFVFEDRFSTSAIAHCCMEPHSCVADYDFFSGKMTVWVSTQSPHFHRLDVAKILDIPISKVRVIAPHSGGAFGSKLAAIAPSICTPILAYKTGRPVRLVHTREEEFKATRTRHPFILYLKTGVKRDGTIIAKQARVVIDNGAYTGDAIGVMALSCSCFASLYRVPNVRYQGNVAFTNKTFGGAFRGYGNMQTVSAVEQQMDSIAEKLGMDPAKLRLKNYVKSGDTTASGVVVTSCGISECVERATEKAGWKEKRAAATKGTSTLKRGMGMASFIHCCGYRGYLSCDPSAAIVKFHDDGSVTLYTGESDMGQGVHTSLAMIAAEELGVKLEDIMVVTPDTLITPVAMGSFGSRANFVGGNAVIAACRDAKKQLLEVAAEMLEAEPDQLEVKEGVVCIGAKSCTVGEVTEEALYSHRGLSIIGRGYYDPPSSCLDLTSGIGNPSAAYLFGAHVAEVEVDTETGQVRVLNIVAAHDVGRVIFRLGVEGQVQGAAAQGMGYGLTEAIYWVNGEVLNANLHDYRIATALDMPNVETIMVETDDPEGPFGAKGVGEPGLIPTGPAIANAIYNAAGVRVNDYPITPDKVLKALKSLRGESNERF
ncbi:xanthine dehydrogenase family protein molybdopterin-binding subunit [Chloroflexota bacterium]